jgi:hypothetical protein
LVKISNSLISKKSQVWIYVPVITATWKADVGGSQFEACYKKKEEQRGKVIKNENKDQGYIKYQLF